jgi:retinol dehydrogenase-12
MKLSGKTAVITGATSGIGLYSLLALARAGASVIGVGRSEERNRNAEAFIREQLPGAHVKFLLADLSLQSQVRRLASEIETELKVRGLRGLDILVNNAGLYTQTLTRTAEGIELTLAVNHLAVFLLTHQLLPALQAVPDARVITVSSHSHYSAWMTLKRINQPLPYLGILAYARSKLANILFTCELNRRAGGSLHAFAVDPGLVKTEIALKERGLLSQKVWAWRMQKGAPPELPAQTVLYLAYDETVTGSPEVYWYNSQPKQPSRAALNNELAAQLWVLSCALCGIPTHT